MKLRDLFAKKDKAPAPVEPEIVAPVRFDVSITTSSYYVEVKQKTPGLLPRLELGGYRSPSGGYMNVARYKVVGVNPGTGRKNTKVFEAKDEPSAVALAKREGLVEPFTVTVEPCRAPSERQLAYALDLEATLPDDASSEDVSAIISRITDDDEGSPSEELGRLADEAGLAFSMFIGATALSELLREKKLLK